ncbi:O-acetylhomoserine aminocarboxypropyltransferase/cysteine synthase [Candidatus Nomurabacteria bacterium]|nr:O-acetylhomoserine aminocarboxypropyltransferase/cysteine synthase [Candidatus Nomurabacteria bacterium]
MRIETKCLHAGYRPGNSEPLTLPVYQSTTFKYDSSDEVGDLFDLEKEGHLYSRISNPTVEFVEKKIAALEGGVGCVFTSSGQSALFVALAAIVRAGDHIVSSGAIYGGSMNLLAVTLKRYGVETTFVHPDDLEGFRKAIRPDTKAVFAEVLSNPSLVAADISGLADIAHSNGIPLIIDNTFMTPVLCRPIEFGADIVVHSTSKYLDGHAVQVGGAVIDSGKFDWCNGKFPEMTQADTSYHGVIYTEKFGNAAYINKLRVQMIRDIGCLQTATGAFLTNLGIETLSLRMEKHCSNALQIAKYLSGHPSVIKVNYPMLEGNKYFELAKKYFPAGGSGVISFEVRGGRTAAAKFMDSLELANIVTHVADVRTAVLHPASTTHRQQSDEDLIAAGITPGLIRLSVGIEHPEDIIEDIDQALLKAVNC